MAKKKIKQATTIKVIEFYKKLFQGTNVSYGFVAYPHSFSPIQYREILLPLPFLKIINTFPMRKSNEKIQTALSYKSHPRMDDTRLDHMIFAASLGVDLLIILEEKGYEIDNKTKIAFLVFLLTHDIGHGPFSHPFEQMVDGYKGMHEDIGVRALKEIPEVKDSLESIFSGLTDMVVNFSKYDKYGLSSLLEGIFDLDRAAFLIMDTYLMDGEEKYQAYDEIVTSVYNIFDSIILKDGKIYYDKKCFQDIDNFIRIRKDNYESVYQEPKRLLYDLILKRIGITLLKYRDSEEYKNKLSKLPKNIAKEIEEFANFIAEMKSKKSDIDLDMYYNFDDNNFNRIFNFLLLLDNPELNRDCLILISQISVIDNYYEYKRNVKEDGSEDFYAINKFTIYKSTIEEHITFICDDGSLIDYKDCEDRFTKDKVFKETISFVLKEVSPFAYEEDLRKNLIEILNNLLLEEEYSLRSKVPNPKYLADSDVIYYMNRYLDSIKSNVLIEEYCILCDISCNQLFSYILMCTDSVRIKNICLMLLSDSISRFIDKDKYLEPASKLARILTVS